jgi:hypothetical protein
MRITDIKVVVLLTKVPYEIMLARREKKRNDKQ